ncbi:MAG: helix-turn-helix transcriptional regulator [Acidimicrobiia bacterium]
MVMPSAGDPVNDGGRLPRGVRAKRHALLADPRRLAIVEALGEGPRQVPELSRLLGAHPTTVRAHIERLLAAGVLEEEPGIPEGRGRPSKRYRLRVPLLGGEPEVRLFVGSLLAMLRRAYGDKTVANAEEEGTRKGRELGRPFRHPSLEQTAQQVAETLEHLSFAPTPVVRRKDALAVDLSHCPFSVQPDDPDGAVVCAFHEGIVRGVAEVASGDVEVGVRVQPFVAPGLCRVELSSEKPKSRRRGGQVPPE